MKDWIHIYNIRTLLSSFGQIYRVKKYLISDRFDFLDQFPPRFFGNSVRAFIIIIWLKMNGYKGICIITPTYW